MSLRSGTHAHGSGAVRNTSVKAGPRSQERSYTAKGVQSFEVSTDSLVRRALILM